MIYIIYQGLSPANHYSRNFITINSRCQISAYFASLHIKYTITAHTHGTIFISVIVANFSVFHNKGSFRRIRSSIQINSTNSILSTCHRIIWSCVTTDLTTIHIKSTLYPDTASCCTMPRTFCNFRIIVHCKNRSFIYMYSTCTVFIVYSRNHTASTVGNNSIIIHRKSSAANIDSTANLSSTIFNS